MAKWQIFKDGRATDEVHDDGLTTHENDPAFSREVIDAYCADLGSGFSANFAWASPGTQPCCAPTEDR